MNEIYTANPYEPSRTFIFRRGIISRYSKMIRYSFSLWLFGSLLACIPWAAMMIHFGYGGKVETCHESLASSAMFMMPILIFCILVVGDKRMSYVINHYLVSSGIYFVASIISLLLKY